MAYDCLDIFIVYYNKPLQILEGFPKSKSSSDPDCLMIPDSHNSGFNGDMREDGTIIYKMETAQELERKRSQDNEQRVRRIQDFLEEHVEGTDMDSLLPPKILLRYALLMDIVNPNCRRSVCFTKGQGFTD